MSVKQIAVSRESLWWHVAVSGSVLLGFVFLPVSLHPRFSVCGFLWLTGRPCPFCGLTRAMSCLLKGEITQALAFHPLSPLVLFAILMTLLGGPLQMVWERVGWRTLSKEGLQLFWRVSLPVFLAYGAWRICFGGHL
jgi:uncharacterized protein DUF2752